MSPFVKANKPMWMSADQLPKPRQRKLKPEHVDAFLTFLFSDVARKPEELRLLEGARVARYLRALALEEEGDTRAVLEYLSKLTWASVLRAAPSSSEASAQRSPSCVDTPALICPNLLSKRPWVSSARRKLRRATQAVTMLRDSVRAACRWRGSSTLT